LSSGQGFFALPKALEELAALPAAADEYVFVLQHGFDDAEGGLGAQRVGGAG